MPEYWLVTGTNRGIGLSLVKHLSTRKDTIIFATVRNLSILNDLETLLPNPNIHLLQLRLDVLEDAQTAASQISKITDHLDVVIANAGIAYNWQPLETLNLSDTKEHFVINTLSTLALCQAVLPLLRKSTQPKFIPISTEVASISKPFPFNVSAVGLSKVGINYLVRRILVEHAQEGLIAFPINPGAVKTRIGNVAAPTLFRIKEFELEPDESARGILAVIDKATTNDNEHFYSYDGQELPW